MHRILLATGNKKNGGGGEECASRYAYSSEKDKSPSDWTQTRDRSSESTEKLEDMMRTIFHTNQEAIYGSARLHF